MKIVANNPKARRDYFIVDTFEAGIVLKGSEIKSIRQGRASIKEAFAKVDRGEIYLYNAHISPYEQASYTNVEPTRVRKLLLHKKQINKLIGLTAQKGHALVPLKLYFKKGLAKIELALGKGKRQYDKRQTIRKKEAALEMKRALKHKNR